MTPGHDIIKAIDAAVGCQNCQYPYDRDNTPSDDFCSPECQQEWHAEHAQVVPLTDYREPWDYPDGLPGIHSEAYTTQPEEVSVVPHNAPNDMLRDSLAVLRESLSDTPPRARVTFRGTNPWNLYPWDCEDRGQYYYRRQAVHSPASYLFTATPNVLTIDGFPPPQARTAINQWLAAHRIDPNDVVVPGWIERIPEHCVIRYLSVLRIQNTEHQRGRVVTWTREIRLPHPPAPFPDLP